VDNQKFKAAFGRKAKMLAPDQVIALTGHAIGGVFPPETVQVLSDCFNGHDSCLAPLF